MGVVIVLIAGVAPGWALVTLPLWVALALLLASGIGLVAAALMVQYRDVVYVLPVAIQFLLYGTPIAYALNAVPESARWASPVEPADWDRRGLPLGDHQHNRSHLARSDLVRIRLR